MAEKLILASNALEAVFRKNVNSAFLAGGTEDNRLNSTVNVRTLISIGRIKELDGISLDGDMVRIGAMTTFQEMIDNALVPDYLKEACRFMGSRTKRNMATIGGNVALRRTDSYLYATLIACHAKLELLNRKGEKLTRCVCCYLKKHDDFRNCLILSVSVPKKAVVLSKRYANTVQSHAVLTVAMGIVDGKLGLGVAAKDTALKPLCDIAERLSKEDLSDDQIMALLKADSDLKFKSDIFGSPEYKRYLLSVTIADLAKGVKGGER